LASDWWGCKETLRQMNALQEQLAASQIEEIERAYKAAKIPGRAPRHWLEKISKLHRLGKPLPQGFQRYSRSTIHQNTLAFVESAKQSARVYFALEYAVIRAKTLKKTQKKFAATKLSKESQARGGQKSGALRRAARDKAAKEIIDLYKSATSRNSNVKPVARLVADWYLNNLRSRQSKRALAQKLQRSGLAT